MTSAEDAERSYDRARTGILAARACLMQWAAPLPDLEVTVTDEQWETVRRADAAAGWAPPEPPGEIGGGDDG